MFTKTLLSTGILFLVVTEYLIIAHDSINVKASSIPDLKVPKLDPLLIDTVEITENGAIVQGRAKFSNLTVVGLSQYVPKNVTADIVKQTITAEISIPLMIVEGFYDVNGVALLLPVKGNGTFLMKLVGVDGKAVAFIEREGVSGVRLARTDIDFNIRNMSTRLENLLGGEEVGEALNNLINDNAHEILKDVKPTICIKLGEGITQILAGAIDELPGEAFILPEGFVPPEGFVFPTAKSST